MDKLLPYNYFKEETHFKTDYIPPNFHLLYFGSLIGLLFSIFNTPLYNFILGIILFLVWIIFCYTQGRYKINKVIE